MYRRLMNGGTYPTSPTYTINANTSFRDHQPSRGVSYCYEVTAINANGESGPSSDQLGLRRHWRMTSARFQRAQTSGYLIQPCMACPAFRLLFRCRQNHLHSNCWGLTCCASILSTAIPVPIAASRKLALPIVSSMRLARNSATLLRIPTILFFRALISADSRRSTARTVSLVT